MLRAARSASTWHTTIDMSDSRASGHVAPATLVVLPLDDEVDGLLQLDPHVVAVGHAVDLGEEQRRHRVAVHPRVPA